MNINPDCFFFGAINGNIPACYYVTFKTGQECNDCSNCKNFISRSMARIIVKEWIKRRGEKTDD